MFLGFTFMDVLKVKTDSLLKFAHFWCVTLCHVFYANVSFHGVHDKAKIIIVHFFILIFLQRFGFSIPAWQEPCVKCPFRNDLQCMAWKTWLVWIKPTEHIWDAVKARPHHPTSLTNLTNALEWEQNSTVMFQHLFENLSRRVEAVTEKQLPIVWKLNKWKIAVDALAQCWYKHAKA